jgi:predicted adenine nucleotide alpha hydrolase (AANH) superfamily ATPase
MENILLHVCCGPCACYPVEILRGRGFEPVAFWHNPNIHPSAEYGLRKAAFVSMAAQTGIDTDWDESVCWDGPLGWFEQTRPGWVNGNKEERCARCCEMRLRRTAARTAEKGWKRFSTTLLYSRYQYHDRISEIGRKLAKDRGLEFLYEDFRKGWNRGIELSKSLGLYRQKYCGCVFSEAEVSVQARGKKV